MADVRRRLDPTDPHRDASRLGAGHGGDPRRPGGLPDRRSPRSHDPAGAGAAVAAMACGWLVIMLLFHLGMGRQK